MGTAAFILKGRNICQIENYRSLSLLGNLLIGNLQNFASDQFQVSVNGLLVVFVDLWQGEQCDECWKAENMSVKLFIFVFTATIALPMMTHVIPLKMAPTYVKQYRTTPNLMESTKSSTRNKRRSSVSRALTCATATVLSCCTFSWDNAKSVSRYSLKKKQMRALIDFASKHYESFSYLKGCPSEVFCTACSTFL